MTSPLPLMDGGSVGDDLSATEGLAQIAGKRSSVLPRLNKIGIFGRGLFVSWGISTGIDVLLHLSDGVQLSGQSSNAELMFRIDYLDQN